MAFPTDNFLEENFSSSSFNSNVLFTEVYVQNVQTGRSPSWKILHEQCWNREDMKYKIWSDWKDCHLETFLKQNKRKKKAREGSEELGSAVRGLLFFSDLDNCSFLGAWGVWSVEDKAKAQQAGISKCAKDSIFMCEAASISSSVKAYSACWSGQNKTFDEGYGCPKKDWALTWHQCVSMAVA